MYVGTGSNAIRAMMSPQALSSTPWCPREDQRVRDIRFRDGYMYVGSEYTDEVLRFNATTGAFVDAFCYGRQWRPWRRSRHGPSGPDANGDNISELYVSGRDTHNVVRYDGATASLWAHTSPQVQAA